MQDNNRICDEGVMALCQGLSVNKSLQFLRLVSCIVVCNAVFAADAACCEICFGFCIIFGAGFVEFPVFPPAQIKSYSNTTEFLSRVFAALSAASCTTTRSLLRPSITSPLPALPPMRGAAKDWLHRPQKLPAEDGLTSSTS